MGVIYASFGTSRTGPPPGRAPVPQSRPAPRLLLYDADALMGKMLARRFGVLGFPAEHAVTAQAVVARAARERPDLLVVHAGPGGGGDFGLIGDVRALPGLQALPALVLDQAASRSRGERCAALGAAGYLGWPLRPAELTVAIGQALQGARTQ